MIGPALRFPARYLRWRLGAVAPYWVTFDVTWNCTCRCAYCGYGSGRHEDLPLDGVLAVLDNLADLGAFFVGLSGGEPLLRDDLERIVSHARGRGLRVGISTNGQVGDEARFAALMRAGVDTLCFSLDGARPETHEKFRARCPFAQAVGAIRRAVRVRDAGAFRTRISTSTVIHRGNLDDLAEVARLRADLGADRSNFQPVSTAGLGPGTASEVGFGEADLDRLVRARDRLRSLPDTNLSGFLDLLVEQHRPAADRARRPECFAGRAFVYVDPLGRMFPCSVLREPLADLRCPGAVARLRSDTVRELLRRAARQRCPGCALVCYMERNVLLNHVGSPRAWHELLFRRGYLRHGLRGSRPSIEAPAPAAKESRPSEGTAP